MSYGQMRPKEICLALVPRTFKEKQLISTVKHANDRSRLNEPDVRRSGHNRRPMTLEKRWTSGRRCQVEAVRPGQTKNASLPEVRRSPGLSGFEMDATAKRCARGTSTAPADPRWLHGLQQTGSLVKDPSGSTILKQRRELQLLMMELKDREKELNAMAAAHHTQHQAWEQDHQRGLVLEQRCACLDEELQKRGEVIRILTKHTQVVETREKELQKELSEARLQLCELQRKQQDTRAKCQDYEEKNQSLSSTVMALSTQVGSLQVREEELSSMLKLKDKDVTETSRCLLEVSGRLRELETALKDGRSQESKLLRDAEENKRRYKEARHEATQLKEELQQQVTQSSSQREEIIRLKQELQLLHRDLVLTGEGDSWKDELLELSRSKQDRIMSELHCLRQVCENQRKDLHLLRLNQENSREALGDKTSQGFHGSPDDAACSCVDHQCPSPLRVKNFRPAHDAPAAVALQASAGEMGIFSARLTDLEFRQSSGRVPAEFRQSSGRVPAEFRQSSGRVPAEFRQSSGRVPAEFRQSSGRVPAEFRQSSGRVPAEFRQSSGRVPAELRQSSGRAPAELRQSSGRAPAELRQSSGTA
ncbi:coiled-coil domain-containing protein 62 [Xenentodon cancila]